MTSQKRQKNTNYTVSTQYSDLPVEIITEQMCTMDPLTMIAFSQTHKLAYNIMQDEVFLRRCFLPKLNGMLYSLQPRQFYNLVMYSIRTMSTRSCTKIGKTSYFYSIETIDNQKYTFEVIERDGDVTFVFLLKDVSVLQKKKVWESYTRIVNFILCDLQYTNKNINADTFHLFIAPPPNNYSEVAFKSSMLCDGFLFTFMDRKENDSENEDSEIEDSENPHDVLFDMDGKFQVLCCNLFNVPFENEPSLSGIVNVDLAAFIKSYNQHTQPYTLSLVDISRTTRKAKKLSFRVDEYENLYFHCVVKSFRL